MTRLRRPPGSVISVSIDAARVAEAVAVRLLDLLEARNSERQDEAPPLLLTVATISRRCGLGQTFIKNEIRSGRLRARKAGDRTVVTPQAFDSWVEGLRPIAPAISKSERDLRSPSVNGGTG
jgi:hypothetical protein